MKDTISAFIKYLYNVKNYSKHTLISYENDLTQLFEFLNFNKVYISSPIRHTHIRSWIVSLVEAELSPKSVNRKISTLRSFFKYLLKNEIIDSNPMSKISGPKNPKRLPKYVDKNKITDILDDVVLTEPNYQGLREHIVISLLYHTGIRRSELIGLNVSDVDLNQKTIKVLGKGNKERLIPLSDQILKELGNYIDKRGEWFPNMEPLILTDAGKRAYPKLIYKIVVNVLRKYNATDKPSPHILRHTFATHLAASGAELNAIKELLGHSSLAATQVYTHNSIERLKEVYDKSHPKSKL